ncbi:branched-chain amino acid ABC transporter permease [Streptosporangium violaceochromogenes]|nr:branched-chain amino acid ABC transporter permease [Streptosporangium violaceochromogenes]
MGADTSAGGLTQVLWGGLTVGCLYAVLLLGVLIVFQVSKSINFAYGQVGMVAALGGWYLASAAGLPIWSALIIGAAAAVLVNSAIDFVAIRRIPEGRPGLDLVVTLGLFLLLTAVMQQLVDANSHTFASLGSDTSTVVGGVVVSVNDVFVIALTLVLVTVAHLLLTRTSLGTSLRASAEDATIASAAGVNVLRLRTGVWAVAGLLAAVVGYLVASRLSVDAFYMTPILVKVFIAGMIGGLDRFLAPLLVAVLLGVYEAGAAFLLGASAGTPAVFLLIIVALAVMPRRFMNERSEVRA